MHKRLKGLEEGGNLEVIDKNTLDRAIQRKAIRSKTYEHNKTVMRELKKQSLKESKQVKNIVSFSKACNTVLRVLYQIAVIIIALILIIAIAH